eukprot:CAMPEP_0173456492 /NCGR_PEP_ID=MMETSP1357-20121228/56120_1 /TAXON_ID=77926 /ORGANISM="Hemiselmis rufescens, Strain PCC563" /LENGTH=125 /DNA_ID=CAMNT_0014423721 /DNA_START=1 /DNA_END=376 /DNA_ORIENTATION=-
MGQVLPRPPPQAQPVRKRRAVGDAHAPLPQDVEFLWQEGHTAHATKECAMATTVGMLAVYERVLRDVMAVPVVKGVKSPSERFAGADETYTVEALMQNGWALQAGTSHFLGQGFAKAFNVSFSNA